MDAGTADSCSDANIFNSSRLKAKIEDGSIGFPNLCPIKQGGPDVPYFILASYGRRMLTRDERITKYRISRDRRGVANALGIMTSRFRVLLTTMEQLPEIVREILSTCAVLLSILRS